MQLKRQASIFACNLAAVISTKKVMLGFLGDAPVYTWVNSMTEARRGVRGINGSTTDSFLNARVFMLAWDTLMSSGQIWPFDFVVKVDPDAVFMPSRLRKHVKENVGEAVYFTNCGKWGGKVLLYGSLEVISVPALRLYHDSEQTCKSLPFDGWGEDYYLQKCLDAVGVKAVADLLQVADKRCIASPCSDYTKVAFHDYKDPDDWLHCYQLAIGKIHEVTDLVPRK